ncbi:mll1854 [Mesorhizobium japonicum MAFF 303099]|uniref:Mll1854 protein n=2 Tax=Phyllobacteriaceae TaxID=69277 RepID=Q98JP1_RHILO|nr:mll1854 [Mesorhizobium japonicum MAFF 303099]
MKRPVRKLYHPSTDRGLVGDGPAMRALWPVARDNPVRRNQETTMTAYVIADIKMKDPKWVPAYAASVHDIVHKHGGKYLSRSGNVKTLEGKPLDTTLIALMAFPSEAAARAFTNDPAYAPFVSARQGGSDSRFQLIDDTDLAGTIPYLPKG